MKITRCLNALANEPVQYLVKPVIRDLIKIKDPRFMPLRLEKQSLAKLFRERYSVTDLSTQYCELKKFYDLIVDMPVEETKAMKRGSKIHQMLEKEVHTDVVQVPKTVRKSKEDEWGEKLLEMRNRLSQLLVTGKCRELYIISLIKGRIVSGYIDYLVSEDNEVVIIDSKSRSSSKLPAESQQRQAYHQLLLYHKVLKTMHTTKFKLLFEKLNLDPMKALNFQLLDLFHEPHSTNLLTLTKDIKKLLKKINISDKLRVEYIRTRGRNPNKYIETIGTIDYEYNEHTLDQLTEYTFSFWENRRNPIGVDYDELIKCKYCNFAPRCAWKASL